MELVYPIRPAGKKTYFALYYYGFEPSTYQQLLNSNDSFMVSPIDSSIIRLKNFETKRIIFMKDKNQTVNLTINGKLKNNVVMNAYDTTFWEPKLKLALISLAGMTRLVERHTVNMIVSDMFSGPILSDPAYPSLQVNIKDKFNEMVMNMPKTRPPPEPVDETIYNLFKKYMDSMKGVVKPIYTGHTLKPGPRRAIDTLPIRVSRQNRRYFSGETPIAVGCLPKLGQLTSSGKVRIIYPMSYSLQYILDSMFSKKKLPYQTTYIGFMGQPSHPTSIPMTSHPWITKSTITYIDTLRRINF